MMPQQGKQGLLKYGVVLLAGAVTPLAFAPYHFYFVSIFSLAVLVYFWQKSTSGRESFLLGYLFAFAMFGIGVNWLHISINLFGGVNFFGALCFTYLLVAFISIYPAICGYILFRFFKSYQLTAFAAVWVLTEYVRGRFLTGFPWLNIGTSQTDSIFAYYAPVIGDYGVSFIVCVLAAILVRFLSADKKQMVFCGMAISLLMLGGFLLKPINWTEAKNEMMQVALIQGAIHQELKWRKDQRQKTLELYTSLSQSQANSDLIIWPETAIPSLYSNADDFISAATLLVNNKDTLFMSGIIHQDKKSGDYFNSVLLIDKKHHFYHKHHLVPFGEYLPLKSWLGPFLQFLKIPVSDFSTGAADQKTFITDKAIIGMSICYEDAYSEEIRFSVPAANLLVNVSNDAWFGDSAAPHQHLQIARMRALESGRYLLRATNTGISAVIDERGEVIARSPQFVPHALSAAVQLFDGATPFSLIGDRLIVGFSIFCLMTLIVLQRRQ